MREVREHPPGERPELEDARPMDLLVLFGGGRSVEESREGFERRRVEGEPSRRTDTLGQSQNLLVQHVVHRAWAFRGFAWLLIYEEFRSEQPEHTPEQLRRFAAGQVRHPHCPRLCLRTNGAACVHDARHGEEDAELRRLGDLLGAPMIRLAVHHGTVLGIEHQIDPIERAIHARELSIGRLSAVDARGGGIVYRCVVMPLRSLRHVRWPLFAAALVFAGLVAWLAHWKSTRPAASRNVPRDEFLLARVGKTTISEYDLDLAAKVGFSRKSRDDFEMGPARKQLLESLIQARAIALAREAELTAEEKLELEKLVQRERENILVKQYLQKHAKPDIVSSKDMRAYYDAHREEFGAVPTKIYEILTSEQRLTGKERDDLIRELAKAAATPDWFQWIQKLRAEGKPVVHYRGDVATNLMKAQLAAVAERLKPGDASEVTIVDGRPHVVRLISVTPGIPKPYEAVANEIRERLSPRILTQAAKQAAAEAMKKVEVVRY
jgi:hypothetical protein